MKISLLSIIKKSFFIATASNHEVNLSPKGYKTLKVLDASTLVYADYPGSGNRVARDIKEGGRITLMWTAFDGKPNIVRTFCKGTLIELDDPEFETYHSHFDSIEKSSLRRLIRFSVEKVESSCGMSIPKYEYIEDRDALRSWAQDKANNGTLDTYIEDHDIPKNLGIS